MWEDSGRPDSIQPVSIPEQLEELCFGPEGIVIPQKSSPLPEAIAEGSRHAHFLSLAGSLRQRGADADEIFHSLKAINVSRCNPPMGEVKVPVGASIFPKEIFRTSRRWAEKHFGGLLYWNELDEGGHFAAFEQPEVFVSEIRNCFRSLR